MSEAAISTLVEQVKRIGGLSDPFKMPCHSYSLPATRCITGSKLARIPGTICHSCYARKGCYAWRSTQGAMNRRMNAIDRALADPEAREEWIADIVAVLSARAENTRKRRAQGKRIRNDGRYFRWHDSGDLQSAAHLSMLVEVAKRTPMVRFWIPTKEARFVREYLTAGGTIPDNLTIRLSVPRIGDSASGLLAQLARHPRIQVATSHRPTDAPPEGFRACGAYRRAGHCGGCRACWGTRDAISYPLH